MLCEQKALFDSLPASKRFKHQMEWEGITYQGYCDVLEHKEEANQMYDWMDFDFSAEHTLHSGASCTFVSCNCNEPCSIRQLRESRNER